MPRRPSSELDTSGSAGLSSALESERALTGPCACAFVGHASAVRIEGRRRGSHSPEPQRERRPSLEYFSLACDIVASGRSPGRESAGRLSPPDGAPLERLVAVVAELHEPACLLRCDSRTLLLAAMNSNLRHLPSMPLDSSLADLWTATSLQRLRAFAYATAESSHATLALAGRPAALQRCSAACTRICEGGERYVMLVLRDELGGRLVPPGHAAADASAPTVAAHWPLSPMPPAAPPPAKRSPARRAVATAAALPGDQAAATLAETPVHVPCPRSRADPPTPTAATPSGRSPRGPAPSPSLLPPSPLPTAPPPAARHARSPPPRSRSEHYAPAPEAAGEAADADALGAHSRRACARAALGPTRALSLADSSFSPRLPPDAMRRATTVHLVRPPSLACSDVKLRLQRLGYAVVVSDSCDDALRRAEARRRAHVAQRPDDPQRACGKDERPRHDAQAAATALAASAGSGAELAAPPEVPVWQLVIVDITCLPPREHPDSVNAIAALGGHELRIAVVVMGSRAESASLDEALRLGAAATLPRPPAASQLEVLWMLPLQRLAVVDTNEAADAARRRRDEAALRERIASFWRHGGTEPRPSDGG